MGNSTLIKLIHILSEHEIRLISKKLKALDRNDLMLKFFNYLITNVNKPNKLLRENVCKEIYSNETKFSDQRFTRLRFQLFHFIEKEILINFLTTEDSNPGSAISSNYIKIRALHNFYDTKNNTVGSINNDSIAVLKQRKLLELKQLIEVFPKKGEFYFLNKYLIAYELYSCFQNQGDNYLEDALEKLDVFFCLAKMKIGAEIGQQNLLKTNVKNEVFEEILNFSQNLKHENIPLIKIYQVIGLLYHNVKFNNLKLLKKLIFENANQLSKQDLGNFIGILNNFTISGQLEQTNDLLYLKYQVIKFGFDNGVFIIDGIIRTEIILNFSFICFELKKIASLKKILNIYCLLLEKKYKEKIQKLCEAYVNILEKNYMPAFNILDNNSFLPYNILAKALRLRCVYELEISKVSYFDGSLFEEGLVFKRYLNRQLNKKKIIKSTYISFMNLVNFLLDLTNPAYTKEELFEMLHNKYDNIRYKNWCKEKVKNLS